MDATSGLKMGPLVEQCVDKLFERNSHAIHADKFRSHPSYSGEPLCHPPYPRAEHRGLTGPSLPLLAGFLNSLLVFVALSWEGGRDPGLTVTR